MFNTMISFNDDEKLYLQLYNHIINEIKTGNLKKDEKLPSKKVLANTLNLSNTTIENALNQLLDEGYIRSVPKSGYYVEDVEFLIPQNTDQSEILEPSRTYKYNLTSNAIDTESFPFSTWVRLTKEVMSSNIELLNKSNNQGDISLRIQILNHLKLNRGINANPQNIILGSGLEYLLMILSIIFKDKSFAVENPGYKKVGEFLKQNHKVHYIKTCEYGMNLEDLYNSNADVAYLTPSNQFPTGALMPTKKRLEFLKWANNNKYIIEDDYNSEFHLNTIPTKSLQGLDNNERVIYLSTFSRTLAPSIRISYMILPNHLMKIYNKLFTLFTCPVSRIEQHTLELFIKNGYYSRHLNRVINIYKKKHDIVIKYLKKKNIKIIKDANLHLLIESNFKIRENAYKNKLKISLLKDFYYTPINDDILILGYAGIKMEDLEVALNLLFK